MAKKPTQTKRHTTTGYAVVTKAGKVKISSICKDRESADQCLTLHDEEMGGKIKRVTVTCEWR